MSTKLNSIFKKKKKQQKSIIQFSVLHTVFFTKLPPTRKNTFIICRKHIGKL